MVAVPVPPAFIPPPIAAPGVRGAPLNEAYRILREDGLAITLRRSFHAGTFGCLPLVSRQSPGLGQSIAVGATVTLTTAPVPCGATSPAVPTGPLPAATVPDFTGAPLTRAIHWVTSHRLYWDAGRLAPVRDADAGQLLANYRITGQSPAPGRTLRLGIGSRHGSAGSFLPTPLHLRTRPASR